MWRRALVPAAIVILGGCASTRSTSTRTSTVAASARSLTGCHRLPFSGSDYPNRGRADFYNVDATPARICFSPVTSGSRCVPAPGFVRQFGDPIIATDEPRSGGYNVAVNHNGLGWSFFPGCP